MTEASACSLQDTYAPLTVCFGCGPANEMGLRIRRTKRACGSRAHVALRRPTPPDRPLSLGARAVETDGDRVVVEAQIESGGKLTATCRGTFVAVTEGHPAFHRWGKPV